MFKMDILGPSRFIPSGVRCKLSRIFESSCITWILNV